MKKNGKNNLTASTEHWLSQLWGSFRQPLRFQNSDKFDTLLLHENMPGLVALLIKYVRCRFLI